MIKTIWLDDEPYAVRYVYADYPVPMPVDDEDGEPLRLPYLEAADYLYHGMATGMVFNMPTVADAHESTELSAALEEIADPD